MNEEPKEETKEDGGRASCAAGDYEIRRVDGRTLKAGEEIDVLLTLADEAGYEHIVLGGDQEENRTLILSDSPAISDLLERVLREFYPSVQRWTKDEHIPS